MSVGGISCPSRKPGNVALGYARMQSSMLGMVCRWEGNRRWVDEENDQLGKGHGQRRWEETKGSVRKGKPQVAKRLELRSKRTEGVAEEDMETQRSKVRGPCYGCLLREAAWRRRNEISRRAKWRRVRLETIGIDDIVRQWETKAVETYKSAVARRGSCDRKWEWPGLSSSSTEKLGAS